MTGKQGGSSRGQVLQLHGLLLAMLSVIIVSKAEGTPVSSIRLVGGRSQYDGVLQVYSGGRWGTVCDDSWTSRESQTACRILFGSGYTGDLRRASLYPTQTAPILMDDVRCTGRETSLLDCQHITSHNCGHHEDVALSCSGSAPSTPVRLVGGRSQYDGVLQVYSGGTWGTVCDDSWTPRESQTACRILFGSGYTGDLRRASLYPTQTAPILMDDVRCTGRETNLLDCQHTTRHNCGHNEDVALRCSDPTPSTTVRLVGGSTQYDGVLQVYSGGRWGTVCDDSWTSRESNTACRILFGSGYNGDIRRASLYPAQTIPILMDNVRCTGRETSLLDCQHITNHNCGHNEDVALTCSDSTPSTIVRLVSGSTQYDGVLQVYTGGRWGTVCDDSWTSRESQTACRILFGSGYTGDLRRASLYPTQTAPILMDDVRCTGRETSLLDCQHITRHNCGHNEDVALSCSAPRPSTTIRLVSGSTQYDGVLQVYSGGRWGTVCDDSWTSRESQTACRILFGSGSTGDLRRASLYPTQTAPILMDNVRCTGSETSLLDCQHITSHNCGHNEDVALRCSGSGPAPSTPVRLVGGRSQYDGVLQVYTGGRWGTVCDDSWTSRESQTACRILFGSGYSGDLRGASLYPTQTTPILMDDVRCTGRETNLLDCQHITSHNCGHSEDVALRCSSTAPRPSTTIRLVSGSTQYDGVLQVYSGGRWGTVCDDSWTSRESQTACRILFGSGYTGDLRRASLYPTQTAPILMDNVRCTGRETSLLDCQHITSHNCGHNEDVALRCSGSDSTPSTPVRLVGGSTHDGVLQVYTRGRWGTVCDDAWTSRESNTACRILFGSGYTGDLRRASFYPTQTAPILMDDVRCTGSETSLLDCQHITSHNCGHNEDVALNCSDSTPSTPVRLVGGSTHDGVLQVYTRGRWGTVCDDAWTSRESNTACRILFGSGYTGDLRGASFYPTQTAPILMDNVRCTGRETSLLDCQHITSHNCGHHEDVALRCSSTDSTPSTPVRLVGGSTHDGVLQVYTRGRWGTVCDDAWTSRESNTACRILFGSGYTGDLRGASFYPTQTAPILMDNVRCTGSETSLLDCQHITSHNCGHNEDVALNCSDSTPSTPVRLVGGSTHDGVLQVYTRGRWGTVCDDLWTSRESQTACRILFGSGYTGEFRRASFYPTQTAPILMDDVRCTGSETILLDCQHITSHNCRHSEDVALRCSARNQPVDGGWSAYEVENVGECSVTCGGGQQNVTSRRTCNNPTPQFGGRDCDGENTQIDTQSCNTNPCPVDGGWSAYEVENVGECSVTCGGGQQNVTSRRTCNNPTPQFGGRDCDGEDIQIDTQSCNTIPCPVDGGWSAYDVENVGECSVTCGGGQQSVTSRRTCNNPTPQFGGRDCDGEDIQIDTQSCNTNPCPVDGGWSAYEVENVGECSVTCGGGQQNVTSRRTCNNPTPQFGGRDCDGEDIQIDTQSCNTIPCPVDGGWSAYEVENVGDCSVTCGGGQQNVTSRRTCSNPPPEFGGRDCDGEDTQIDTQSCNTNPCPVDGGWSEWDDWQDSDECSALCGGGAKDQWHIRRCDNPAPANGGRDCEGVDRENRNVACNTQECADLCPEGENTFISNTNNAGRYYQCAHGVATLMNCPNGTLWDQSSTSCIHDGSQQVQEFLSQGDQCDSNVSLSPHQDCTKYIWCVHGVANEMSCPAGTRFNPVSNVCDLESNVPCDN